MVLPESTGAEDMLCSGDGEEVARKLRVDDSLNQCAV